MKSGSLDSRLLPVLLMLPSVISRKYSWVSSMLLCVAGMFCVYKEWLGLVRLEDHSDATAQCSPRGGLQMSVSVEEDRPDIHQAAKGSTNSLG